MNNFKEDTKKFDNLAKYKCYCKKCGHPMIISPIMGKVLCNHCHNYIFRNKKEEFLFRLQPELKKKNRQNDTIIV